MPSEYYRKVLLTVFDQMLQFYPLGEKTPLPKNAGKVVKWLIYSKLSAATTALTEGVPPSDTALTTGNATATVSQYGGYTKISDLLEATAIDPVVKSAMERMGKQGALTIDTLCRNVLDAALPNQFANGKASLATTGINDVATAKEFLKAAITLQKDSVNPHTGTDYVAVLHPANVGDLQNDTNVGSWVDLNKYIDPAAKRPFNGEAGKVYQVRILMSQNVSSTTSGTLGSATVYSCNVLGEECFGVVSLDSKNISTTVKPAGSGGSLDPLDQVGTVGWKALGFVPKYLGAVSGNVDRGVRVRAGSAF
jgi:N4-gp56 family major capsid protein